MPQKPCINGYYFCVVQMEELFAIAVSFGKIVRTRGFSRVPKNPKLFNASHATFSHAFCLVFVFTRDARKERTNTNAGKACDKKKTNVPPGRV